MNFLINQGLKRVGRKLGKSMFNDTLNVPEAYADRIAQEFGNEWHDAYEIYRQNPEFWEGAYGKDAQELKGAPRMTPLSRTSRLPETPAPEKPAGEMESTGRGFWENLFPGRSSLREAQGRWRE
ncbi:hypothetical protein JVX98_10385 [Ensifer sp. PDNC004]|uniref:hypothetical protein n=1 Tax=Ensifer sp. PDNC004 TaxID=2811423 RepID=UPI0019668FD9|nr:hypothetical protein [Ensifer sp. PDNC004]QRY68652.1 hypothetical protein JVX98_10385 [Ensifer sp. PDNC004]